MDRYIYLDILSVLRVYYLKSKYPYKTTIYVLIFLSVWTKIAAITNDTYDSL
jgi:hypothetical protein